MASKILNEFPSHKEVTVDFPLEIPRHHWGNTAHVYVPPAPFNFFAITSHANEGLEQESGESFIVDAYEKDNDGTVHVGLPYEFAKAKLYQKKVIKQTVEQGTMLAVVVYYSDPTEDIARPPVPLAKNDGTSEVFELPKQTAS